MQNLKHGEYAVNRHIAALITFILLITSILTIFASCEKTEEKSTIQNNDLAFEDNSLNANMLFSPIKLNAADSLALASYTVKATIQPATASNQQVDWKVEWASNATLKNQKISDYLSVTPDSDGSLSARVDCYKSFIGNTAVLSATTRNGKIKGTCNIVFIGMQSKQNDIKNIDAIECNRYLFNFVGTFYSYINFYEKNYNELFKDVKKHIYDTYFEYRFIYNLRNYIIHEDLAILRISKKFWQDHVDVNFEIDNNALSDSSCCQQRFKQELKNCSARMTNLHDVLSNFYIILLRLHIDMLTKIWQNLRTDFLLLMDNIPNRQEVYLLQDGKIKNGLLNVTTKYYKCVSDNFVYAENLLQEENVNKFYLDISFLYYKERNVLYLGKPNN